MGVKLDGKPVAQALREDLIKRVEKLAEKNVTPTIQIIRVGENPSDLSYERGILKNCDLIGIKSRIRVLPLDVTQDELVNIIKEYNVDPDVHGILLFRPLPSHIDLQVIRNVINPVKDIDCMNPINLERVMEPNFSGIGPCTAKAVIALMKYYNMPLKGADITVVGASLVVGKPLANMLTEEFATVSLCHIFTKDVAAYTKNAEIVVTACGVPKLFGEKYFNENAIVIDVGINFDKDGKLCGDVDYDAVFDKVKAITPTAGGIGVITTTILLSHVVEACEALTAAKSCCTSA